MDQLNEVKNTLETQVTKLNDELKAKEEQLEKTTQEKNFAANKNWRTRKKPRGRARNKL